METLIQPQQTGTVSRRKTSRGLRLGFVVQHMTMRNSKPCLNIQSLLKSCSFSYSYSFTGFKSLVFYLSLGNMNSVCFRWETDPDYCATVKKTPPYDKGTRLVDFMDLVILDFLMSMLQDRVALHYSSFQFVYKATIDNQQVQFTAKKVNFKSIPDSLVLSKNFNSVRSQVQYIRANAVKFTF